MHIACSAVAHAHAEKTPVFGRYSYKVQQGDLITVSAEKILPILHNLQTSVK